METEILLYGYIYDHSVAEIIREMEAAKKGDVVFRVNTPGGYVMYAYGIYAKYAEMPNKKRVKVDGAADSCGAFLCCYAEYVECLDVTSFTFHRAALPDWMERDPFYFTEGARESLKKTNDKLRAAMEGKMREEDFIKETGVSYDDLFSLDSRIDVELDAQQAERLGLVQKVIQLTPDKKAEVSAVRARAAATRGFFVEAKEESPKPKNLTPNTTMTIEKFKAEHPEIYAAAVKEGVTQERERVGAYLVFNDVDPEAVVAGIEGGEPLGPKAMAELSRKSFSKDALAGAGKQNAGAVITDEPGKAKTEAEQKTAEFSDSVRKRLGIAATKS